MLQDKAVHESDMLILSGAKLLHFEVVAGRLSECHQACEQAIAKFELLQLSTCAH